MKFPFRGGCQRGALRYECTEFPRLTVNCHCTACQKTSGASHVSVLNVPISAVQISGEVRRSVRLGDNGGKVESGFCAKCGSRIFGYAESLVGHMNIMATSLDDPCSFRPSLNIYVASAPPWHQGYRSLPSFDTVPPSNTGAGQ
jgi:hypothetical protein